MLALVAMVVNQAAAAAIHQPVPRVDPEERSRPASSAWSGSTSAWSPRSAGSQAAAAIVAALWVPAYPAGPMACTPPE